jgi:hypothetical protein
MSDEHVITAPPGGSVNILLIAFPIPRQERV